MVRKLGRGRSKMRSILYESGYLYIYGTVDDTVLYMYGDVDGVRTTV